MATTDTHRDIEVVRLGFNDFRYDSPTLSGMVYETTADGRRPLPHTRVLYSMNDWNGFDVYTDTDADGRYIFCRIPRGPGRLGAGDCDDAVFTLPVDVKGDTVVDVDLRPFKGNSVPESANSRASARRGDGGKSYRLRQVNESGDIPVAEPNPLLAHTASRSTGDFSGDSKTVTYDPSR